MEGEDRHTAGSEDLDIPGPSESSSKFAATEHPGEVGKVGVESNSNENGEDDETFLDKCKNAADGALAPIVCKAKTAAHILHSHHVKATGVSNFFHPTGIHTKVRFQRDSDGNESDELSLLWRARDQRKGRNSIAVPLSATLSSEKQTSLPLRYTPKLKSNVKDIISTAKRMATTFAYWDMSWIVGFTYTIGSALFVCDGFLAYGPVKYKETWSLESKWSGPLCFFIGTLLYQVGAVTAYLEAVNDGSFHGAAMHKLLSNHEGAERQMLDDKIHQFFSHIKFTEDLESGFGALDANRSPYASPDGRGGQRLVVRPRRDGVDLGGEEDVVVNYLTWRWYPSRAALRSQHVYEIGFLACAIQLFGVTLYGITGIVVLPPILSSLEPWQKLAAFWIPQIVAALCFLIASLMFMFETQEKWWKPEIGVLGWWIGFWSVVGSIGFELIAIFGILALHGGREWAEGQADIATIWGSGAYFIGSLLQWYESLSKNDVEELFNEPGPMKTSKVHPI
ncbi:Hypothetical protein R9X50_00444500 [Acrodontium crateriforme]|uniref:Integral membrane protein n=1 Tax=Acrodontium crateriforme TaxID=150365 RepID=A0AAQ3M649_9PEZI|nr:Hypothetical protein R9X50_00444500 [Acrodontium crateriforme]